MAASRWADSVAISSVAAPSSASTATRSSPTSPRARGSSSAPTSSCSATRAMIAGGDDNIRRPRILLLPPTRTGTAPCSTWSLEDYEETNVANEDAAHDFRLRFDGLVAADANAARVHVEYGRPARRSARPGGARPGQLEEPRHRPRRAEGAEHGRQGPPAHDRRPGQERRRRGRAQRRAQGVVAAVHDEPGTWNVLPAPPRLDIGKSKTVEFRVPWTPPKAVYVAGQSADHFCVKADVDVYVDPSDPAHNEIVVRERLGAVRLRLDRSRARLARSGGRRGSRSPTACPTPPRI